MTAPKQTAAGRKAYVVGMLRFWVLMLLLSAAGGAPPPPPEPSVDFRRDVQPILEKRCTPCHFAGGKMHEELPFDESATITRLGERLFTRIKADDERRIIRAFLQQH